MEFDVRSDYMCFLLLISRCVGLLEMFVFLETGGIMEASMIAEKRDLCTLLAI
tara:strand:+ start:370 stop:528 length:159 start_codon:yes stop_codon:yes gene_type:complete